jgi:hypothetical protein
LILRLQLSDTVPNYFPAQNSGVNFLGMNEARSRTVQGRTFPVKGLMG